MKNINIVQNYMKISGTRPGEGTQRYATKRLGDHADASA